MKFNFFPLNFLKSKLYSTTMIMLFLCFWNREKAEPEQRDNRGKTENQHRNESKIPKKHRKIWILLRLFVSLPASNLTQNIKCLITEIIIISKELNHGTTV